MKKFEELSKRLENHRKENMFLKGNDLRHNVYLKKMNKLMRMDMGLDVEAYKDFLNNMKFLEKYEQDTQFWLGNDYDPVSDANVGNAALSGPPKSY